MKSEDLLKINSLKQASKTAQYFIKDILHQDDIAVDATCGNGYDTLFLSNIVGENGHVYAIDVQEQALKVTSNRIEKSAKFNNITLIQGDHSQLAELLSDSLNGKISAFMFNLGYLPGTNHQILTNKDSTLEAVKQALALLASPGIITVVCYPHEEGQKERDCLFEYLKDLSGNFNAYEFKRINRNNPPELIIITKD